MTQGGTPGADQALDAQLRGALRALVERGDPVAVIRLVERWLELGSPPVEARVEEARALLDLRLADRAWVRLREVIEQQADHIEALLLMGEMFVQRGWPQRARRLVERLEQLGYSGPRLEQLRAGAAAPSVQPAADAREIERAGSPEAVLALAESYLLAGSVIRAQALLERLARADSPAPRVNALLWGIRGEFQSRGLGLAELVAELAPEQAARAAPGPFGGFLRVPEGEPAEPETAEVSRHHGALELDGPASFPQLFRLSGGAAGAEMGHDDEVTMAAVLARPGEIEAPPLREDTDPNAIRAPEGGDTQILQVISSGAGRRLGPVEGPMHERSDQAPGANLHRTLDLKAWQQEMGVAGDDPEDDYLEEEDQDLVVLTRRGDRPPPSPEPPAPERRAPVEVLERPLPPPAVISAPPVADDDTPHAAALQPPAPPPARPAARAAAPPPDPDDEGPASGRRVPWPALVLIGAVVGLALFAAAVLALRGLWSGGDVESTSRRLSEGDPAAVTALSASLSEQQRRAPDARIAAELALTESFRFALLDGDPGAAAAAELALGAAAGPDRSTAEALWRYGLGDLAGAQAALGEGEAPANDVAVGLRARLLIDAEQPQAAVLLLSGRGSPVGWTAALTAEALAASGDEAAAKATLDAAPPSLWVQLAQGRFAWSGLSEAQRVALLGALVARTDAPALAGEAGVALAGVHERAGRREAAREAWSLALKADPYGAAALVREAAQRLERGEPAAAAELMERCLRVHSRLAACQRGRVQALLALGEHVRAARELEAWAEATPGLGLLPAWVKLAAGERGRGAALAGAAAASAVTDPRAGPALAAYLAALELRGKAGGDEAMERAAERLAGSGLPLDRALATVARR